MAHIIRAVSTAANGTQGNYWSDHPAMSADGRYVAFASLADNLVARDTNGSMVPRTSARRCAS
jgi:nitrous oxidase accessory protein NosD